MATPANPNPPAPDADGTPPRKSGKSVWVIVAIVAGVMLVLGVICLGVVAAIAIPSIMASKVAAEEVQARMHLKQVGSAQAQYFMTTNGYAASGQQLFASNQLIPANFAAAFQANQNNGDSVQPVPLAGYSFRMLLGEGTTPTSFVSATTPAGQMVLHSWAVTCRPDPNSGHNMHQFYTSEAGTVYAMPDPGANTFLLDAAPTGTQQTGWTLER